MALLHRLRRWYYGWHFAGQEHTQHERERIAREHEYVAARLEALQADLSRGARVLGRGQSRVPIPFPWHSLR